MGRQQRPVYICDKCGKESLEKRDVRKIVGNVTDGEGQHKYVGDNFIRGKASAISTDIEIDRTIGDTKIGSNMFCLECLPKVLKVDETQLERKAVDLLKERVQTELPETILANAKKEVESEKRRQSIRPESFDEEKEEEESIDDDFGETSDKLDQILDVFDEETEEEEEEPVENPTTEDNDVSTNISNAGQYHVLAMIHDVESEEVIAKFYKFESVEDMRSPYGGPLIGVYATTGKYVDEIPEECEYVGIKVILNARMGIPDVADIDCYVSNVSNFAFIDRAYLAELMGAKIEESIE